MSDTEPEVTLEGPGGEAPATSDEETSAPADTIANRVNDAAEANSTVVPSGDSAQAEDGPVPVGTGMATSTLGAQTVVAQAAAGEYEEVAPQVEVAVEAVAEADAAAQEAAADNE